MWKLESAVIVLSALFCFSQCQDESQNYFDASSSVKSYTAQYNKSQVPRTVVLKNRLYTVILDNDTIDLASVDTGNDRPLHVLSCRLSKPDTLRFDGTYIYNKAAVLGNGKLLLVTPAKLEREEAYCVHIIIDPFDCSSQKIVKVPCQPLDSYDRGVIAVIPYRDSYDVITNYGPPNINSTLYPKNPQRFNDKGEQIELDYFIEPDSTLTSNDTIWHYGYSINTIKPFDASEGYYCSYKTQVKGIVLQRLNSRFETVKEISVPDSGITAVSTTHGHINYCAFGIYFRENTTCKLLNADLDVTATSEFPKVDNSGGVTLTPRVINLPNHQGLVAFFAHYYRDNVVAHSNFIFTSVDFYLRRVDSSGAAFPYWKIGNASHVQFYSVYGIAESERNFCYVILAKNLKINSNVDYYMRCLDLYAY